jgi:hypothetical protein
MAFITAAAGTAREPSTHYRNKWSEEFTQGTMKPRLVKPGQQQGATAPVLHPDFILDALKQMPGNHAGHHRPPIRRKSGPQVNAVTSLGGELTGMRSRRIGVGRVW